MNHFEELHVGATFHTGSVEVTEDDIRTFAAQFDPQPFHLSREEAEASVFGRLVASGWHTAALTMRLIVEGELQLAGGMIGLGTDGIHWPQPVLPGDHLHAISEIVERRPSRSRPNYGIVKIKSTTLNQRDEMVQVMTTNQLVLRKES